MKSTELRIGNLVLDLGIPKEVLSINSFEAELESRIIRNYRVRLDDLKPIPLTEEWLAKLGYDLISENHYGVLGHLIWKIEGRFYCDKNGMQLKYVHQLQNLYFALTNEELTIK